MKCAVKHREREDIRSEAIKQAVHYMLVTFIQFLGDSAAGSRRAYVMQCGIV